MIQGLKDKIQELYQKLRNCRMTIYRLILVFNQ